MRRLTLAMLCACWTIYTSNIGAVLSLPPSLIANAASLHQQQQHERQERQLNTKTKREQPKTAQNLNGLWPSKDVKIQPTTTTAANKGGNVLAGDSISKTQNPTKPPHSRISRGANAAGVTAATTLAAAAVVPIDPRTDDLAYDFNNAPINVDVDDDDVEAGNVDIDGMNSDTINYDSGGVVDVAPPLPLPFIIQQANADGESSPSISTSTATANEFFTPLKYWSKHCQPGKNCPKPYYRALLFNNNNNNNNGNGNRNSNSNKANLLTRHPNGLKDGNKRLKIFGGVNGNGVMLPTANYDDFNGGGVNDDDVDAADHFLDGIDVDDADVNAQNRNNDIFMYLNGEQDVIKFLSWAMQLLYPHERLANFSSTDADYYHPGMFIWKKLNLSGNVEPPFYADEPHYIIVRREQITDDIKAKSNYNNDDPFIPPRGRKHNMPDLDALLHRYETFVPNRGRRDKIKDMLKSDDLFFPNRGKRLKQKATASKRDMEYENGSINHSAGGGKSEKNANKNDDEEAVNAANVDRFDFVNFVHNALLDDNIENESTDNDDDDDDDWYKKLPLALIVRDTLAKLWRKKLQNEAAAAVGGNKITTKNPHQINYFSKSNKNNPEWLPAMLNYKFNDYYNNPTAAGNINDKPTPQSSSLLSSMPMAMTINGETREMSTPKATKNNARLMQLMLQQQPQLQQFVAADEIATGYAGGGGDGGAANLYVASSSTNSLPTTRSMSTAAAMAQRRQQLHQQHQHQRQLQLQRQRQRLHHLNDEAAATMSQELNANTKYENANWQQPQDQSINSNHRHHQQQQLMPFTNLEPLLWRQLQLQPTTTDDINLLQQKRSRGHQSTNQAGFLPQVTLRQQQLQRLPPLFTSKAQRAGLKGVENRAHFNDYNYFDI